MTGYKQNVKYNETSSVITVQLQDQYGNPVTSGSINVTLTTSQPSSGKFYSDPGGTTQISSVVISAGSSSASFYYMDTAKNTDPTITASSPGLTQTQFHIN